jgi:predicted glycosyltransferase
MGLVRALLEEVPDAAVLMLTGSLAAGRFSIPPQVDQLKLPSLTKVANDHFVSTRLAMDRHSITQLRASVIEAATKVFKPDLLLIDFYPLGVNRELEPTLRHIRLERPSTALVLGWRDVLDEPEQVWRDWGETSQLQAIEDFFDAVLVYGCRRVYDPVEQYQLSPTIASKITFTGYLFDDRAPVTTGSSRPGPTVVCTLGGGKDGAPVGWAFLEAMKILRRAGWTGDLVTGPLMPEDDQHELAAAAARIGVPCQDFAGDLTARIAKADAVVAMGGYNTICDVLAAATPSVVVPRTSPRKEQFLRATRLSERGLVTMLRPDDLSGGALAASLVKVSAWDRAELRQRIAANLDISGHEVAASVMAGCLADRLGVPA